MISSLHIHRDSSNSQLKAIFVVMNLEFNKNDDAMRLAVSQMKQRLAVICQGGGKKAMDKAREKGKMSPRERIQYLIDKGSKFTEIGAFTGYEMYKEHGGCPAGGTVAGLGYVNGRQCVIVANDNTVKAGAWFPITGKKNLRLQEIAMENHLPTIYIVDSAGVYLPMQDEIFPDKEHFGRIFRNNAQMSAIGIPQIAAVMGSCVAGGAYLPIMSDETLMVEGNGSIFLAGPYLVKAAIGEDADLQALGGAKMHTEVSGIADYKFDTEQECLDQVRRIIDKIGERPRQGYDRAKPEMPPKTLATSTALYHHKTISNMTLWT
jgi:acetyl-CoA carboxylase carboxyltransferase component